MQSYVQRMFQYPRLKPLLPPSVRLIALECVIEAAVNVEDQPEYATTDKLCDFVSHLKNDSMIARYTPYFFIW